MVGMMAMPAGVTHVRGAGNATMLLQLLPQQERARGFGMQSAETPAGIALIPHISFHPPTRAGPPTYAMQSVVRTGADHDLQAAL
jgi:hypothetical protein